MKRIFTIFTLFLLIMASPFNSMGKDKKVIDFNYPQDVSKEALADLDNALKSGDGQLTVDALVRYSIAQSGISQDNMPEIVERLESTIAKEKQPHIKALLYYFEAVVYQGYRDRYARWSDRNNPVEEVPADVSEWDRKQFDKKIKELIEKSLAEPEALKAVAVTSLPEIIECNMLGATYVPTLHEFLLMKGKEMLDQSDLDDETLVERIKTEWLTSTEANVPAHVYALVATNQQNLKAEYERYRDNMHCAYLLNHVVFDDNKAKYAELKDYLRRFPYSIYAAQVENAIIDMEQKTVHLRYPEVLSSHDSITVTANVRNANSYWLNVYRAPDDADKGYRIDAHKLKLVLQTPVAVQGIVPFDVNDIKTELPPLPYGYYFIVPMLDKDETPRLDFYNYDMLRVTDIGHFIVKRVDNKDLIAAVDIKTGKPLADVSVLQEHRNKYNNQGNTGKDGTLSLKNLESSNLRTLKGDDHYGPQTSYYPMAQRDFDQLDARFYSDLGVYRPGETVQWAVIVNRVTDENSTPLGGKSFKVVFKDPNHETLDTLSVVSDEYGRIEGSFVVPKDRMNGKFFIYLESPDYKDEGEIGCWSVDVSEYKTPTFEVTFPDARSSYVAGQPVKVTGKAMTYSGLPVQNTEVRLSLIQNEWSWWWWSMRNDGGVHLMDTTVMTDAQGNFTIEFPAELFKENIGYKPGRRCWARYNYQVVATVTTDAGETHEESTSFIVGTRRGIELGSVNNDIYLNDKPIKLPLKYNTTDEEHPDTWCTWEVAQLGE